MIGALLASMPLLVGWLDGRAAARRALRTLALGAPLLALASSYWLVPTVLQLKIDATSTLANPSSWTWTEGRATLANGFWLNNDWGWKFAEYFPYAGAYGKFPLLILKFLLPITAFGFLALARFPRAIGVTARRARLGIAASAMALFLVLLSTGTRLPGALVFDPLYELPLGWLLREPGRFLMLGGLAYSVLLALTTEAACERLNSFELGTVWRWRSALHRPGLRLAAVSVVGAAVLAPGFPLMTGAIAPVHRPLLPSARVSVPAYWTAMASYLNGSAPPGNLLVLPEDDFYQMPYTWGYYGADGFITNLIARNVVDPVAQGYAAASAGAQRRRPPRPAGAARPRLAICATDARGYRNAAAAGPRRRERRLSQTAYHTASGTREGTTRRPGHAACPSFRKARAIRASRAHQPGGLGHFVRHCQLCCAGSARPGASSLWDRADIKPDAAGRSRGAAGSACFTMAARRRPTQDLLSPSRPDGSTTSSCCQPPVRSSGQVPPPHRSSGLRLPRASAIATRTRSATAPRCGPEASGPAHRPRPPSRRPGGRRAQLQVGRFLAQRRRLRVWHVGRSGQLCGVSRNGSDGAAGCACPTRTGPGGTAGARALRERGQCVRGAPAGLAVRTAVREPLGPQRQRSSHRGYASGRCLSRSAPPCRRSRRAHPFPGGTATRRS